MNILSTGGVTDLRVQLHRKRMLRGDRESPSDQSPARGPAPKQRRHPPPSDPRDVDEREGGAIGRMVVRAGLGGSPKRKSAEGRHIVISRPVRQDSASSDSENDDLPIIKKSKRYESIIHLYVVAF